MQSMKHLLESFGASFSYQRVNPTGPFRHLNVALIADELTRSCPGYRSAANGGGARDPRQELLCRPMD